MVADRDCQLRTVVPITHAEIPVIKFRASVRIESQVAVIVPVAEPRVWKLGFDILPESIDVDL